MTATKADDTPKMYNIDRQKFREEIRWERLRAAKGESFNETDYMGDLTPTLRPMIQVMNSHLKKGQTFSERDLITLRIVEEANFCDISIQTDKSDEMKLCCRGPDSFWCMQ